MSQTLNIIINIKEAGAKVIGEIINKVKDLNAAIENTQAKPIQDFVKTTGDAAENISHISEEVKSIGNEISHAFGSIANQAVDNASSTFERFAQDSASIMEQIWTKTLVAGGIAAALSLSATWNGVLSSILSDTVGIFGVLNSLGSAIFGTISGASTQISVVFSSITGLASPMINIFSSLANFSTTIQVSLVSWQASLLATTGALSHASGLLASLISSFSTINYFVTGLFSILSSPIVAKFLTGAFATGAGFLIVHTFLRESTMLFKRLIGQGQSALTPLERASRFVSTIDISFSEMSLKAGTLFKTATLGILTFMGPFSGILAGIPFINSAITSLLAIGTRFRLQVGSFFGSSRAQIGLIFLDLRSILEKILPPILKIVKKLMKFIPTSSFSLIKKFKFNKLKNIVKQTITNIIASFKELAKNINSLPGKLDQVAKSLSNVSKKSTIKVPIAVPKKKTVKKKEKVLSTGLSTGEIEKQKKAIASVVTESTKLEKSEKKLSFAERMYQQSLKISRAELEKSIKTLLDYDRVIKAGKKSIFSFGKEIQPSFGHFGYAIKIFSKLGKVTDADSKKMKKALSTLGASFVTFGKGLNETKKAGKVWHKLGAVFTENMKIDQGKVKKAFAPLEKELDRLKRKGIITGKDTGAMIVSLMSIGMRKNKKEAAAAAKLLAEAIASYFPRSLPKLMPLRNLPLMGFKIPLLLAQGIKSGIKNVINVVENMANGIKSAIEEPFQLGLMSQRTGVAIEQLSALDYAMKTVGGSASDLEFQFSKFNKMISGDITDKQSQILQQLDIDMQSLRRSTEPSVALWYKLSAALKKAKQGTKEYNDILNIMQTAPGSKIINAMMMDMNGLSKEAVKVGAVIDSKFAKVSKQATVLSNKILVIKNRIFNSFLKEILPDLITAGEKLISLFEKNSPKIQVFLKLLAEGIRLLGKQLVAFINILIEDPKKAFDIFVTTIDETFSFLGNTIAQYYTKTKDNLFKYLKTLGTLVIKIVIKTLKLLFSKIKSISNIEIPKIVKAMFVSTASALAKGAKGFFTIKDPGVRAEKEFIDRMRKKIRFAKKEDLQAIKAIVEDKKKLFEENAMNESFSEQLFNEIELAGAIKSAQKKLKDAAVSTKEAAKDFKDAKHILRAAMAGGLYLSVSTDKIEEIKKNVKEYRNFLQGYVDSEKDAYTELKDLKTARYELLYGGKKKTTKDTTDDVAKGIKGIIDSVRPQIEELNNLGKGLAENIFNKEETEKVKARFKKTLDEIGKVAKGTKLEGFSNKWKELFSQEHFDELLKNVNDFNKKVIDKIDEVSGRAKNSFEIFFDFALKTFHRLTKELKNSSKIEISILKEKIAAEGDEETKRTLKQELARKDLQEQQNNDYEEFAKLVKGRADEEILLEQMKNLQISAMNKFIEDQNKENEKRKRLELQKTLSLIAQSAATTSQIFSDLYELSGKKVKEFFYISKGVALAEATVRLASAMIAALDAPGPAAFIQQAMVAASGVVQIGKIVATTIKGYAEGGLVDGPDGRDVIHAKLTKREFVEPADVVDHYHPGFFELLRKKAIPKSLVSGMIAGVNLNLPTPFAPIRPAFAAGGAVTGQSTGQSTAAEKQQQFIIANFIDPGTFENFLASTAGTRILKNVISNNPDIVTDQIQ